MEFEKLRSKILQRTMAAVVEEIATLCRESSEYLDYTITEAAEYYSKVSEALGIESGAGELSNEAAQTLLKERYISEVEARASGLQASRESILQHAENAVELVDVSFAALLPADGAREIIRHIAMCCAVRDIAWTKMNREMDAKSL